MSRRFWRSGAAFSALAAFSLAQAQTATTAENITVTAKHLLKRNKDVASAISEITQTQIEAQGTTMGSIQTLLKQTPSVQAYTQGPGQVAPTMAIRGERAGELAETLDGIPITDLLGGSYGNSGNYLSNNVGSPVVLSQIQKVDVYAGVAPPDKQGFGTVGGTVAYSLVQPTDKYYTELEGGIGSFHTHHGGININTGKLWDDVDAPSLLVKFDKSDTAGYVQNTYSQFQNILVAFKKPYDDGLSNLRFTFIDNSGRSNVQSQPTPTSLIKEYGFNYNFPNSDGYYNQRGTFRTFLLSDSTTITPDLIFDGSFFYTDSTETVKSYANPSYLTGTVAYTPNIQVPYSFFGCMGPGTSYDAVSYNPTTSFGSCAAGEDAETVNNYTKELGFTPKFSYFLPFNSQLIVGGLIAKESATGQQYVYGSQPMPEEIGYNAIDYGGGAQRTVYSGYIMDKTDLLDDKLHIAPGLRIESAYSSNDIVAENGVLLNEKLHNFTKQYEPYIDFTYDLPHNVTIYANYGMGSLFAPVSDYYVGANGGTGTPNPEVVHMYQAGARYDTSNAYLSFDTYLQKVDRAFGYYENYATDFYTYNNDGGEKFEGFELDSQYKVSPELSLFANGSYNNAYYTKSYFAFTTVAQDQYGYAYAGQPLSNVPRWLANYGFEYDKDNFTARVTGQYTGSEYISYDLVGSQYADSELLGATTTDTQRKNPASMVFNALFTYTLPVHKDHVQEVKLSLNIQNIFDRHYYNYLYNQEEPYAGVYGVLPTFDSGLIAPPRNFTFDIATKF